MIDNYLQDKEIRIDMDLDTEQFTKIIHALLEAEKREEDIVVGI